MAALVALVCFLGGPLAIHRDSPSRSTICGPCSSSQAVAGTERGKTGTSRRRSISAALGILSSGSFIKAASTTCTARSNWHSRTGPFLQVSTRRIHGWRISIRHYDRYRNLGKAEMKGDLGGVVLSTHDRHLVCKHPVGDLDLQISYAAAAEMLVLCQFDASMTGSMLQYFQSWGNLWGYQLHPFFRD